MSTIVIYTIVSLSLLGVFSALILFFVARKFKVYEDPRIDQVEEALPAANCGGCGYAGCRNFAEALVKSESFDDLFCPVGGNETMNKIAGILGREAVSGRKPTNTMGQLPVLLNRLFMVAIQVVRTDASVMVIVWKFVSSMPCKWIPLPVYPL